MDLISATYLFWICLGLLLYTWVGYPLVLLICERLMYRPVSKAPAEFPVTILIPAYDEEETIAAKIENCLELDYPGNLLEIMVASDGSRDMTCDIVRKYADRGVKLLEFHTRRGKPSVLNDTIPKVAGEIVILADSRQRLEKNVVRELVSNFSDPSVGAVSGELMFETPEQVGIAVSLDTYWRYEKWIRMKESGIHSTVGGTGALFALRKELFTYIPGETILDDVVLPFHIVRSGHRVIMEPKAKAWDTVQSSWYREFSRKTRTLSGNFQILFSLKSMGPDLLGPIGLRYLGHKVLRLLGPICLFGLFVASRSLAPDRVCTTNWQLFHSFCYYFQVAFYLLAILGYLMRGRILKIPCISLPHSFVIMQLAVVVGFLRYASGRDDVLWEKARTLDPATTQQRVIRLAFDSALFIVGFVFAFYLRYWGTPPAGPFSSYTELAIPFELFGLSLAVPLVIVIPLCVFYFFRLSETDTEDVTPEFFLVLIKGVFYATLVLFFIMYIKRASMLHASPMAGAVEVVSIPSMVLILGFFLNCVSIGGWRLVYVIASKISRQESRPSPNLVMVDEQPSQDRTIHAIEQAFTPSAHILSSGEQGNTPPDRLKALLSGTRPSGLIISPSRLSREGVYDAVSQADDRGLAISILPGNLELLIGNTLPRLSCYIPLLDLQRSSASEVTVLLKRVIDKALGLVSLLLMPFLAGLLLLSRKSVRRAAIAKVIRVGTHGQLIEIPRLRNTSGLPRWLVRTARLALSGWCLLKGELTLVGARPLTQSRYSRIGPVERRFMVCKPGIYYLRRVTLPESAGTDPVGAALLYYARNCNPAIDVQILLKALLRR